MLLAVLAISGFCTLLYEVSWIRMLGLRLGTSPMAVSAVLSAFFLGMAVGSLGVDRHLHRVRRAGWLLGALQILIGISGVVVTHQLSGPHTLVGVFLETASPWLRTFAAFAVMLPATACVGATLPVAIAAARNSRVTVARLYATYNIGAAAGALAAGFLLLPAIGYARTVLAGATAMLFAGVALCLSAGRAARAQAALAASRGGGAANGGAASEGDASEGAAASARLPRASFVLLLTLTGFGSTCLQIVLIRYFALLFDSTIYGLSAVMAGHLLGFSLGSWDRLFPRKRALEGVQSLGMWLVLLGLSILVIPGFLTILPRLGGATASTRDAGIAGVLAAVGFAATVLVPTVLFGRIFPLALREGSGSSLGAGDGGHGGASASGLLCGVNTIGATAASVLTGLFLIPHAGSGTLLKVVGVTYCLAALLFIAVAEWPRRPALRWAAVAAAIVASLFLPGLDYARIRIALRDDYRTSDGGRAVPRVLYFAEGRVGNVSVVTFDGWSAWLETDGLKEARIDLGPRAVRGATEMLLGLVPYMMAGAHESALVLGYGGGTTAELLARTELREVAVVEIEPKVVDAVLKVKPEWAAGLRDGRIRLEYEDARHLLVARDTQYDIIASQPSHPWRVGSGNFFTREFFELVRTRLRPGGVYAQWLNLFNIEAPTVESTLRAFYDVFPHALVLSNPETEDLILVGSGGDLTFALRKMAAILSEPRLLEMLATQEIRSPGDVLWYFEAGRKAFADGVQPNTDTRMLTEFQRSHAPARDALAAATMCDLGQYVIEADRERALALLAQRLASKPKWGNDDRARVIAGCAGGKDREVAAGGGMGGTTGAATDGGTRN